MSVRGTFVCVRQKNKRKHINYPAHLSAVPMLLRHGRLRLVSRRLGTARTYNVIKHKQVQQAVSAHTTSKNTTPTVARPERGPSSCSCTHMATYASPNSATITATKNKNASMQLTPPVSTKNATNSLPLLAAPPPPQTHSILFS